MSSFSSSSSSTESISSCPICSPAPNPRLLNFHETIDLSLARCREKVWKRVEFVRPEKAEGEGEEEKKDDVTSHQHKGSLPSPLSSSHSPFAFYSPSYKTVLPLPRWLSVPPRLAKQAKVKKTFFLAKATLSLCDSRATGFQQNLLERTQIASPSELADREPKMKPKINFLFAEQTFGSHMFVYTLTLPGQSVDADLSENQIKTGFGLQNLPNNPGSPSYPCVFLRIRPHCWCQNLPCPTCDFSLESKYWCSIYIYIYIYFYPIPVFFHGKPTLRPQNFFFLFLFYQR